MALPWRAMQFESKGLLTEEECKLVWKRVSDMQVQYYEYGLADQVSHKCLLFG